MTKKIAQELGGRPTVEVKKMELQKLINDSLTALNKQLQQAQQQLTQQMTTQLNQIVQNLNKEVETKLRAIRGPTITLPPGTAPGAAADDREIIPGGIGEDLSPKDVDPKQLEMGIKVELEHTGDKDVAKEIALDHLAEDPKYYTKLKEVHQDAKDRLGPRGKKQNLRLPDFWRRNFDYGESPYMHLDKIKTITDKPRLSKRKK